MGKKGNIVFSCQCCGISTRNKTGVCDPCRKRQKRIDKDPLTWRIYQ